MPRGSEFVLLSVVFFAFFFSTGDENVTGIKSLTAPSSVSSHDTRKHRCGELRRPCKILLTAVFPICNGLTAVNIWREGGSSGVWWRWEESGGGVCARYGLPGEGHFARSREPAGKNTVAHGGSPGS